MLWFNRPEFDRYARFKSHGSVREVMDWDEMCNVELPVPSYEEQLEIVSAYKAISERILLKRQINYNLAVQAAVPEGCHSERSAKRAVEILRSKIALCAESRRRVCCNSSARSHLRRGYAVRLHSVPLRMTPNDVRGGSIR